MKRLIIPVIIGLAEAACSQSSFSGSGNATKQKDPNSDEKVDDGEPTDVVDGNQKSKHAPGEDEDAADNAEADLFDEEFRCEQGQAGFIVRVYRIPQGTNRLPDFGMMTPVGQITSQTLDVPPRDFNGGFPGVQDLIEWFGVVFEAKLEVPESGTYMFKTNSDDGSKLFIDRKLNIDNDGTHAPQVREGAPVELKARKTYRVRVDWFQGPRVKIALQVYWKRPGEDWTILPMSAVTRGQDCDLQVIGTL